MKRLFYSLLSIVLFLPAIAAAQNTQLQNPLPTTDVRELIGQIISVALQVSGSLALLMFVYGGFLWLTSGGNPQQVDKGKKVLLWATIGIVLIASAFVIVTAIFQGLSTGDISTEAAT